MWKALRIGILLIILVIAIGITLGDRLRTRGWTDTLWIGVFPVNADGQPATDRYIAGLSRRDFAAVEEFFSREAHSFGVGIEQPVRMELYPQVAERPPLLAPGSGIAGRIWWSLQLRYYSWRMAHNVLADIRVFVLYQDPDRMDSVPDSVGLEKGLVGVVYAYASEEMGEPNNVIIAHEVMHTLGATDKYDPETTLPLFPQGYADPQAAPRYPQPAAEIMAGRTAISPTEAVMPLDLSEVIVGPQTAAEVNWLPATDPGDGVKAVR